MTSSYVSVVATSNTAHRQSTKLDMLAAQTHVDTKRLLSLACEEIELSALLQKENEKIFKTIPQEVLLRHSYIVTLFIPSTYFIRYSNMCTE